MKIKIDVIINSIVSLVVFLLIMAYLQIGILMVFLPFCFYEIVMYVLNIYMELDYLEEGQKISVSDIKIYRKSDWVFSDDDELKSNVIFYLLKPVFLIRLWFFEKTGREI